MAKKKLDKDEKEELKAEGELPKKSVRKRENEQLIWFFVIVAVIFASFLVPYFWVESTRGFEYGNAEWFVEEYDYPTGIIYHGRFATLSGANLTYNIYLRGDPRENNVKTIGTFDKFKNRGVVSMTPEVDKCRGELSRVMLDLGSFIKSGVGATVLESGSTDPFIALETDRKYALCNTVSQGAIFIIDIGEPSVIQDSENEYCYKIYAENCNDITAVEKFMIKSIIDFGGME
jgi:hypothetical protein